MPQQALSARILYRLVTSDYHPPPTLNIVHRSNLILRWCRCYRYAPEARTERTQSYAVLLKRVGDPLVVVQRHDWYRCVSLPASIENHAEL
jgi:hypothetical protein